VKLGEANSLTEERSGERISLKLDEEYRPLGFSADGEVSGELAFVGYGISASEKNYDDYKDINVTGKIAVALRFGPDGNDIHSDLYRFTSFRNKARVAREKGALALIMVDGTEDEIAKLAYDQSFASSGIPCISLKRSVLERWLKTLNKDLRQIQDTIKATRKSISFMFTDYSVKLKTEIIKVYSKSANVLGYLEGNDPKLKEQVVVLGAHFDHLGLGGVGSGSLAPDEHAVHNGADDNASGTSALLELAQKFASNKRSISRTLVFAGFTGEEMGLLGSTHYVSHPALPLSNTIAMLNLDMVGRMENNSVTIQGIGTSPKWKSLVSKWNIAPDTLTVKTVDDGAGPSDHASFYGKDIPVLFFFTSLHGDYHKPSDDWDKLNYAGEQKIVNYVYNLTNELQSSTDRPVFTKAQTTASPMGGGDGRGFSVTLGVTPDYGASAEGMKIGGTRANGPAEKAGLKAGDIITKLAGKKVLNIYDYMGVLGELKAGDVVEIEVLRGEQRMTFSTTMQKR
jgi:aminopeptidase YwaD